MPDDKPQRKRVRLYDDELPYPRTSNRGKGEDRPATITDISAIEERFCWRYTIHYNRALAAMECGYSPVTCTRKADELLARPLVQNRIAQIQAERLRQMQFDGDLHFAYDLLTSQASPTELVELLIPPCRYCYGINNEYQRTYAEYTRELDRWNRLPDSLGRRALPYDSFGRPYYDHTGKKLPFDEMGGDSFDPEQRPNPACPNCKGRGAFDPKNGTIPYQKLKDTRDLTLAGKVLFAGMKANSKGTIDILMRDQEAARNRVGKMVEKFLELRAGQTEDGKKFTTFDLRAQGNVQGQTRITRVERIIIDPPKRTDDDGDEYEDVA